MFRRYAFNQAFFNLGNHDFPARKRVQIRIVRSGLEAYSLNRLLFRGDFHIDLVLRASLEFSF